MAYQGEEEEENKYKKKERATLIYVEWSVNSIFLSQFLKRYSIIIANYRSMLKWEGNIVVVPFPFIQSRNKRMLGKTKFRKSQGFNHL